MPNTEERQAKTETEIIELKLAQTRTELAISKISDALDALSKIAIKNEEEKGTALRRALVLASLIIVLVGGIVGGASYLINAQLAAGALVTEHRLAYLENFIRDNARVTVQWKTSTEGK